MNCSQTYSELLYFSGGTPIVLLEGNRPRNHMHANSENGCPGCYHFLLIAVYTHATPPGRRINRQTYYVSSKLDLTAAHLHPGVVLKNFVALIATYIENIIHSHEKNDVGFRGSGCGGLGLGDLGQKCPAGGP